MNDAVKHAKTALVTAAAVLAVIYVLRKAPIVGPIAGPWVNRALTG